MHFIRMRPVPACDSNALATEICAIGVLAGPVTVKISQTYFNTPGRNLIFLWTGMILSGLLSLTVEFFRATPVSCPASEFSWGEDGCGLPCSPDHGPMSPLRGGSQNNIYVIKVPSLLPFGTATLLSAACCIPAILSLVSMWNKILKLNWTKRFGDDSHEAEALNEPISGTNSTPAKMAYVNNRLTFYLSMVEIPVFVAAILAILIVGERNFFDYRVSYMTEPIASVGQWAPIVGTGLAAVSTPTEVSCSSCGTNKTPPPTTTTYTTYTTTATLHTLIFILTLGSNIRLLTSCTQLGSLYALLATDGNGSDATISEGSVRHCDCPHHFSSDARSIKTPPQAHVEDNSAMGGLERDPGGGSMARRPTYESGAAGPSPTRQMTHSTTRGTSDHTGRRGTAGSASHVVGGVDVGSRRKVARAFELIGEKLGTPAPDAFDDSAFLTGPAADFPTVPAEEQRNPELTQILASYNPPRDSDGNATPNLALRRQRSRAGSFAGSMVSGLGIERLSEPELYRTDTVAGPSSPSSEAVRVRRDTLEVPTPAFLQSPVPRKDSALGSASGAPVPDATEQNPASPTIRISPESLQ